MDKNKSLSGAGIKMKMTVCHQSIGEVYSLYMIFLINEQLVFGYNNTLPCIYEVITNIYLIITKQIQGLEITKGAIII